MLTRWSWDGLHNLDHVVKDNILEIQSSETQNDEPPDASFALRIVQDYDPEEQLQDIIDLLADPAHMMILRFKLNYITLDDLLQIPTK